MYHPIIHSCLGLMNPELTLQHPILKRGKFHRFYLFRVTTCICLISFVYMYKHHNVQTYVYDCICIFHIQVYISYYIYTHYISYIHYIIHICRLDASVPSNSQLTHISRRWTPICTKKSSYDELWISHLISPRICVICGSWGSFIILLTAILTFGSHMMVTGLVLTQMNGGTPKAKVLGIQSETRKSQPPYM